MTLKTAFQIAIIVLAVCVPVYLCIKVYNVYHDWELWRQNVTKFQSDTIPNLNALLATPEIRAVVTRFLQSQNPKQQ